MKKLIALLILFGGLFGAGFGAVAQAELTTRLDRTTVLEDETVRLIIEQAGQVQGESPDFSPLLKDFEILDRTQSTQMEIVNGRGRSTTQWIVEIAPKRTGDIEIPPITVGRNTAPGVTLRVTARESVAGEGEARTLFIETEVDNLEPYVQSQVRLIIRLFQSVNANILDGTLTEPKPEDAVVQRLGDDVRYQTRRGDQGYVVIERRYAVFPAASGPFEIPPILFDGHVADAAYRQALRDRFFSRGRRTRLRSDPIRLDVRPRPEEFTGTYWLPARNMKLKETWSEENPVFRVGEPVTRTVTLEAQGLDITQLPELDITSIEGAKVYPDKPATRRWADNEWVFAMREQKLAVVPTRAGAFTLPEVRLAWWDTRADEQRTALIPAREIDVLPASGVAPDAPPSIGDGAAAVPDAPVVADAPAGSVAFSFETANRGFWPYLSVALFIAWILTLLAWWQQTRDRKAKAPETREALDVQQALQALRKACKRGEPRDTREALLAWGRATFAADPPLNLGGLSNRIVNAELDEQLRRLDAALYGDGEWDGGMLWKTAKEALRPPKQEKKRRAPLPELYPQPARG